MKHIDNSNIYFYDLHPPAADFRQEVLEGLATQPKHISPKFFYDERGSQLFEKITMLAEYYPTNAEIAILQQHGEEIAHLLGKNCLLVELGSGSSQKIRLLLDALQPSAYLPFDISKQHLIKSAQTLAIDYPDIPIHATCADYSDHFVLPYNPEHLATAAFFPGSSIGNFEPEQAQLLLTRIAQFLGKDNTLIVGVDVKKDPQLIQAAYNDEDGITAEFNLNLLHRINKELEADFIIDNFRHHAFYNPDQSRLEMHLMSDTACTVQIATQKFEFAPGETIHTENSYKYSVTEFQDLAAGAGFDAEKAWLDENNLFSVHCLRVQ